VSYNSKHNEANGEHNRDGTDDNAGWNCGAEGPSTDPAVEKLRHRQVKNFLALNLFAIGTPMLLAGDEVRRTQRGNNNAYCQDNELSWFDWSLVEKHAGLRRFVKLLVSCRLDPDREGEDGEDGDATLEEFIDAIAPRWHGVRCDQPDFSPPSRSLAVTVRGARMQAHFHLMVNAYWDPLEFELPPPPDECEGPWRLWIDTFRESPGDVCPWHAAEPVARTTYPVQPRSLVVLILPEASH
jgi:isoamylase